MHSYRTMWCLLSPRVNHAYPRSPLRGSSSLSRLSSPTMCCGLICSVRHNAASLIRLPFKKARILNPFINAGTQCFVKLCDIIEFAAYCLSSRAMQCNWQTNAFFNWVEMFSELSDNQSIVRVCLIVLKVTLNKCVQPKTNIRWAVRIVIKKLIPFPSLW